jgi:hypothetical protein
LVDLTLSNSDIEFSPNSPVLNGTNVTINATIFSYGKSVSNIEVRFYNGDPDKDDDLIPDVSSEYIGNDTINVNKDASTTASIKWTPPMVGFYDIYVWIDPENLTEEYDDSNNLAFNTLEVFSFPPPPPSGLGARFSPSSSSDIELIWNSSTDDGAGEDDVVGYTIYRSNMGVNGTYQFAAWIPANDSLLYNWTDMGAGDGDPNDYFYIVRANDTLDNEELNNFKVGKFVNYLVEGWNLVSTPLYQTNTTREHVLQTIEGNYSSVYGYHAGKSRPWLGWHRDKPNKFNDVFEINHEEGYYIDMLNPDHLVVCGVVPANTQIQLKTGWNLVSYPSLFIRTRDDALSSISGMYTKVYFYNVTSGRDEVLGPSDMMHPGYGYWIHVHTNCVWEVPL